MSLRVLDAGELRRLLPMESAIDALEAAFAAGSLPDSPPRVRVTTAWGDLLATP